MERLKNARSTHGIYAYCKRKKMFTTNANTIQKQNNKGYNTTTQTI